MSQENDITHIDPEVIRVAIEKIAAHQLHKRLKMIDGSEPGRIVPELWPIVQELCLLCDLCEAGHVTVVPPKHSFKDKIMTWMGFRQKKPILASEMQIRVLFQAMHHPEAGTRRLVDARRIGR